MAVEKLTDVALSDGELVARFVPHAGMLCRSLRHRGTELLAQNAGLASYAERGKTMGIPLLYPWANRLAGFDYEAAGKAVQLPRGSAPIPLDANGLPIHGILGGRLCWRAALQPAPVGAALRGQLSWGPSAGGLFELFPFRHELLYEARVAGRRLTVAVTVHASGTDPVPVAFGFHPYFAPPGIPRERWTVRLPTMRRLGLDSRQIPDGSGRALSGRRFELADRELDDGFDRLPLPAQFEVQAGGMNLSIEFQEGYPCAQIYAPRSRQCVCFEPMTAPTNALRSGVGLRVLEPGERYRASFAVGVGEQRVA
jgi:galactose mutarotase-like enzyme